MSMIKSNYYIDLNDLLTHVNVNDTSSSSIVIKDANNNYSKVMMMNNMMPSSKTNLNSSLNSGQHPLNSVHHLHQVGNNNVISMNSSMICYGGSDELNSQSISAVKTSATGNLINNSAAVNVIKPGK